MPKLSLWHKHIWDLAEPAWREYKSAQWYVDLLRTEGFTVEAGSASMPTAFSADWSFGDGGPVLLTYAEYDAVPGNCQSASTEPSPRDGLSPYAPGHTDPHSALGISTLAGLLGTKHAMEVHGIAGTLKYTGEPAEKVQGSKVVHGLRGYYDGVDAIVSFHPFYMLPLCNTARWDTQCGSYYSKVYTFVCDEPETWQLSRQPELPHPGVAFRCPCPGRQCCLDVHVHLLADHAGCHAAQLWRLEPVRCHLHPGPGHRGQPAGPHCADPVLLALPHPGNGRARADGA